MSRYPLVDLDPATLEHIAERGGRPINLYRVLGNQPALLHAWIDFASALRYQSATPRQLRELLILRIAQCCQSSYEWSQHLLLARQAGVPETQIRALEAWRDSPLFDPRERAALALTEAAAAGRVDDPTHAAAAALFSSAEMTELVLTASFYCMVARVLDAMAVDNQGE
jgi:alkylhydroperoxidase family enzyme